MSLQKYRLKALFVLLKILVFSTLLIGLFTAFIKGQENASGCQRKQVLKEIVFACPQEFQASKRYKKFEGCFLNRPLPKNFSTKISSGLARFFLDKNHPQEVVIQTRLEPLGIADGCRCLVDVWPKQQLRFGKIFLGDKSSSTRTSLAQYQEASPGPDIGKMLCFAEGDSWSWAAIDQSIKNLQECPLFKTAEIKIVPDSGSEQDCPVEIFLEKNFDKQYKLRIGGELQRNAIDKYLVLECDAFNYKIKNSVFNVGMDLRDCSTKFKAQYEIPTTIFMPINFLFFVNSQFDRPDKKVPLGLAGGESLENYCQNCLTKKVAENTLLSSTKVGISIEPRKKIFDHKFFYNIIFDRQKFDLKDLGERNFLQQFVFRRQNIENSWSNRIGNSFSLKATVGAAKNQVVSEFCISQNLFLPVTNTSCFALLLDFNFGTRSNFFKSFKQLCKNAASLIYPQSQIHEKKTEFCDFCYDQKFRNMFPPVSDRIKHENCISEPSFLYCDGLFRTDSMLQLRKKFTNAFSGMLFHTLFYTQGADLYNTSGLGVRYNSAFGTFCFDLVFKWNGESSIGKRLASRLTFGESF